VKRLLDRGRRPVLPPREKLVGRAAEAITGMDAAGAPAGRSRETGAPQLIAFLTGGCTTCQLFWAGFADPHATATALAGLPVVVVTPGPGTESRRGIAARVVDGMEVIMSTEAWIAYGVTGAPWFALVADGKIAAEGPAGSWAELAALTGAPPTDPPGRLPGRPSAAG
jgi:hypothetical protein